MLYTQITLVYSRFCCTRYFAPKYHISVYAVLSTKNHASVCKQCFTPKPRVSLYSILKNKNLDSIFLNVLHQNHFLISLFLVFYDNTTIQFVLYDKTRFEYSMICAKPFRTNTFFPYKTEYSFWKHT